MGRWSESKFYFCSISLKRSTGRTPFSSNHNEYEVLLANQQRILEALATIETKIDTQGTRLQPCRLPAFAPAPTSSRKLKIVSTIAELDELERKLEDTAYYDDVVSPFTHPLKYQFLISSQYISIPVRHDEVRLRWEHKHRCRHLLLHADRPLFHSWADDHVLVDRRQPLGSP